VQFFFSDVSQKFSERLQQITIIWRSLPILTKVLILIGWTIMIPFILALAFSIFLILVFVIPNFFLLFRWISMVTTGDALLNTDDIKVPTFFATEMKGEEIASIICMPVAGVVFGGIHCVGWFFDFPSRNEAMLWRVSSAVLTGTAFLFPISLSLGLILLEKSTSKMNRVRFVLSIAQITLLVYIASRLLLLVEAFISLRHLTPGMLALVKWTSFIPHI
jgi:hypothetical protein